MPDKLLKFSLKDAASAYKNLRLRWYLNYEFDERIIHEI